MTALDAAAKRLLEQRAQEFAQPLRDQAAVDDGLELLVFSRAGTSYAVEADVVVEVVRLDEPVALASVPAAIAGVVSHRGRIIAVVDVAAFLPGGAGGATGAEFGVVVQAGDAWFALTADIVSAVARVGQRELRAAAELGDGSETPIRSLTADLTAILDVEALARDPRVEVDDDVE
jgi:chemotaxis signal transduction protein